jgi:hypothetical protein
MFLAIAAFLKCYDLLDNVKNLNNHTTELNVGVQK